MNIQWHEISGPDTLPESIEEGDQTPKYLVTYEYTEFAGSAYRRTDVAWWTWRGEWRNYFLGNFKNFETDARRVVAWAELPDPYTENAESFVRW